MDHRRTGPTESLAAVDRRIVKALIVRQEILVARLAASGGDVATGRETLEEMRSTLAEMYRHRRLILGKVEGSRGQSVPGAASAVTRRARATG